MGRHSAPGRGRDEQIRAERAAFAPNPDARRDTHGGDHPTAGWQPAQPDAAGDRGAPQSSPTPGQASSHAHGQTHGETHGQAHQVYGPAYGDLGEPGRERGHDRDFARGPGRGQAPGVQRYGEQRDHGHGDRPGGGYGHPEHRGVAGSWAQQLPPHGAAGRVTQPPRSATPQVTPPIWQARHAASNQRLPVPGPREEDVAAFDGLEGRQGAGIPATRVGGPGDHREEEAGPHGSRTGEAPRGPEAPEDDERPVYGGRGRTFTGVAAAAVTTVLAVVVAGQVAEHPVEGSDLATGGDVSRQEGKASRSEGRSTPERAGVPEAKQAPASLHQRLRERFPLAKDLALSGAFTAVGGAAKGTGGGAVVRYRVDVEKGLPLDGELFAELVHETLNDPRSWGQGGARTFERVASGPADFVITLASPGTTDVWCAKSGLDTSVDRVSCDSASTERVMINAYRWARGAATFGDDMLGYRQMLINHEVGHRLGRNHEGCPTDGALAPVMMQQTKYLTTNGATCKPNPWPFPQAATS